MCGRLACYLSPSEWCKVCSYKTGIDSEPVQPGYHSSSFYKYIPLYNLSPSLTVPVLIDKNQSINMDKNQLHNISGNVSDYLIVPMRWGMLPRWEGFSSDTKTAHTHNARLENIWDSPMYGYEIRQDRRCVILCNGYYEWQTTRADRQPYYLYHENVTSDSSGTTTNWAENATSVLKLAGIFSQVVNELGDVKYSCSMITKEADSNLSWLHHRMPIALHTYDDVQKWIRANGEEGVNFLKKYGDVEGEKIEKSKFHIKFHAVNKIFVNKSTCESNKCIVPYTVKRKNTLDDWICKRKPSAS